MLIRNGGNKDTYIVSLKRCLDTLSGSFYTSITVYRLPVPIVTLIRYLVLLYTHSHFPITVYPSRMVTLNVMWFFLYTHCRITDGMLS